MVNLGGGRRCLGGYVGRMVAYVVKRRITLRFVVRRWVAEHFELMYCKSETCKQVGIPNWLKS